MIIYESPYRLVKTLTQLAEVMGEEREAAVCREISKLHADTQRGTLAELIQHFTVNEPKGEIVIVVAGAPEQPRVKRDKYADKKEKRSIED